MKKNPYLTFNVPVKLKEKIEKLCREKGLSKAQLVKNFFINITNTFDSIKQAHIIEIETLKKSHVVEIENAKKNSYQKGASDTEIILTQKYEKELEGMNNHNDLLNVQLIQLRTNHVQEINSIKKQVFEDGRNKGFTEGYNYCVEANNLMHVAYLKTT